MQIRGWPREKGGRGGKRRKENETKTDWQGGWEGRRKNGTWCSINGIYIHATGRDGVLGGKKREGGGRGRGREGGTVRYSITSFRSISKVNWSVAGRSPLGQRNLKGIKSHWSRFDTSAKRSMAPAGSYLLISSCSLCPLAPFKNSPRSFVNIYASCPAQVCQTSPLFSGT